MDTCRKLLKLFHPECPDVTDDKLSKMCSNGAYDWVDIRGDVKGYGRVGLVIDNGWDTTYMYGTGWSLSDFELRQPKLQFKIWRSVIDKDHRPYPNSQEESVLLNPEYTRILQEAGYRTKTAGEWMDEYYSD